MAGPFATAADVKAALAKKAAQPPTSGTSGQVLARDTSSTTGTAWVTPAASGGATVGDATATAKGVVQLAGDLAGTAAAPTLKQLTAQPKTVGSSTTSARITVDTAGRVTAADEVAIAATSGGAGGGVTATVDGTTVTALSFTTGVSANDVNAIPRPTATPSLGQVPAVTSASPLVMGWVTPNTSGGGGGVSGPGLNVTTQGVKNDGIILNDLVVNSGSTTVTSESGPFTSTTVDAGKIVYWRTSAGTAVGTIASVSNPKTATLTSAASASSVVNGGPNNNSVLGTDNTAALNAVFAAAQATQVAVGSFRVEGTPAQALDFPPGVYVTKALNVMKGQGVVVRGSGLHNTYIASGDDNPWIQLDTLNTGYAYSGAATYWQFQDLQFINPCHRNGDSGGNRRGIAVQDNGSGNALFLRCKFVGLRYGFAAPTASDFTKFRDCYWYLCDVGTYLGIGTQQVDFAGCDWALCMEGVVNEGAPQWHIGGGSSWEDNVISAVTFEGKSSGQTRFGLGVDLSGGFYSGQWTIDGAGWFETNSGGNGTLTPRQIWVKGDGPYGRPFEGLTVRDMLFVAGGNQVSGGTNTFLEVQTTRNDSKLTATIDHLVLSDPCFVNSIVRNSGTASTIRVAELFCTFPTQVAETQGNVTLRAQRRDGTMTGFTVS